MTSTAPQALSPSVPAPVPAGRPRVLVVDDSRVIRMAIKKILEADFEVETADSGDAAWGLLSRGEVYKMLVTDIEMPGMDGYELICRIRGSDGAAFKDVPILTITGAEDEQTKERAFACGATDFITKPIDPIQLKARAQSYVRLEQSARDLAEKASQLEDQAIADPVTGLRSRRYLLQRGEQDLAYCVRNQKDATVIRFDIDRYKDVYLRYGDDVNDKILAWLADIITASARLEDTVARVAGAKFAILATATDIDSAKLLCQRIRKTLLTTPFTHADAVINISLSFGLSSLTQDRAQKIETLLNLAEERVGRAAVEGGDRVCVSVLGESAPNIEELVLDAPAPMPAPVSIPAPVASIAQVPSASPVVGKHDAPEVRTSRPELSVVPDPVAPDPVVQWLSIDKALQLVAAGKTKSVEPYLKALHDQLRPLLDLIARGGAK